MTAAAPAATSRRRGVRALLVVLGALLVVLVAAGAWIGIRGLQAKDQINGLTPIAQSMRDAFAAGNLGELDRLAPEFAEKAASAATLTGDPVWRAAEVIPGAGANLGAVRIVSSELDSIASEVPALTSMLRGLTSPTDGRLLPLDELREASPALESLDSAIKNAADSLGDIDTGALIGAVASGVDDLRGVVREIGPAVDTVTRASHALPAMLGVDGERSILVMIQNSAELRTGGGITGTFAEVRAIDGALSLVRQAESRDFPARTEPIVAIPDDVTAIYGDEVGRFVQNVSMPPDFDLSGELATAWWESYAGTRPDTVISIDPFVLQSLLSTLGPVDLAGGGQLTAENLVDTLLVQPYAMLDGDEQTVLYQSAVGALFSRLSSGGFDVVSLASALAEPVSQGRVSVWNANDDETDTLGASVSGPLARQDASGDGTFAVYFNDATGAKMAGFLDITMDATVTTCVADAMSDVVITLDMISTAPADAPTWPVSVTGGGLFGVGAGDIGTNVSVEGPVGSFAGKVVVKGANYAAPTAVSDGRAVSAARVNLSPGEETNRLEFHFTVPSDQARDLALMHTPLMGPSSVTIGQSACR